METQEETNQQQIINQLGRCALIALGRLGGLLSEWGGGSGEEGRVLSEWGGGRVLSEGRGEGC